LINPILKKNQKVELNAYNERLKMGVLVYEKGLVVTVVPLSRNEKSLNPYRLLQCKYHQTYVITEDSDYELS